MIDLNLSPRFKNSTTLCCKVIEIFFMYRPTRYKSVHDNYQHVQGCIPTTTKIKIIKMRFNHLQKHNENSNK